eukprot:CAMPEP_0175828274 /NCGR_PEP_ID=MMETSP0107_2-20121207/12721_1 /TAXON_ID=195067 ORGANISM="Goniomonas pacifica, Strain CCMP1869" /NCGR_SAMPLE_ID=MMETSP0107_2 /ASSEMBLY_ACC=CAM_ASM_000203 /LENGTH=103 /DNA_ID=CAMNT_0017140989 /DNA_START=333 /DNA_END=644 /DNA_ORIENTATION=+
MASSASSSGRSSNPCGTASRLNVGSSVESGLVLVTAGAGARGRWCGCRGGARGRGQWVAAVVLTMAASSPSDVHSGDVGHNLPKRRAYEEAWHVLDQVVGGRG